jgi:protein gp37
MTLNEQKAESKSSIEWTRVWGRRGYTWNPIAGCPHQCRWTMPSGDVAICYAENIAHNMAQKAYPQGFDHHYWKPQHLSSPKKLATGAGIFVGSMSDVFAHSIPAEHIQAVLDVIADTPQHVYFMLTKNPVRSKQFEIPANVWLGASMPPDFMWGNALSMKQKEAMMHRTLETLSEVKATVKWVSFEPLSWSVAPLVAKYAGALNWAVIGAASHGRKYFPPHVLDFLMLKWVLESQGVPMFFKGNMTCLEKAKVEWHEDFPPNPDEVRTKQKRLFYDTD